MFFYINKRYRWSSRFFSFASFFFLRQRTMFFIFKISDEIESINVVAHLSNMIVSYDFDEMSALFIAFNLNASINHCLNCSNNWLSFKSLSEFLLLFLLLFFFFSFSLSSVVRSMMSHRDEFLILMRRIFFSIVYEISIDYYFYYNCLFFFAFAHFLHLHLSRSSSKSYIC